MDIEEIETKANLELEKLAKWLEVNRLSLNIKKTQYMVFNPNKNSRYKPKIKIDLGIKKFIEWYKNYYKVNKWKLLLK